MDHTLKVTKQCSFVDEEGKQCNRKTTITHPMCAFHTRQVLGLYVAPSTIKGAGMGLFTTKPIKRNTHIINYEGEKISQKEYDKRYSDCDFGVYGMTLNSKWVIDARATDSGLGRYICDYRGSNSTQNVEYLSTSRKVEIWSIRDIEAGEELLVDYGKEMLEAMGLL